MLSCSQLLPFALLLCNITRASSFAEMVLKSHTVSEVRANISKSMAMLGPSITLDTITEMLFIGMGSLSGIIKLYCMVVTMLIHSCLQGYLSWHTYATTVVLQYLSTMLSYCRFFHLFFPLF